MLEDEYTKMPPLPLADPADYIPETVVNVTGAVRRVGPWPWLFGLDFLAGIVTGKWLIAAFFGARDFVWYLNRRR